MRIQDLEWLVVLAEIEHMTDAAAVLGTSQPNLSRALARCEAELGTRLFERVDRGLELNPGGRAVVEAAREIVARYAQVRSDLATWSDPDAGLVRLGFLDSMGTTLIPRVLKAFRDTAPRIRVQLTQEPTQDLVVDLDGGVVELAFASSRPAGPYGWEPIQRERLLVVVEPGHRWATRRRIALAELAQESLVTTPVGFGFRTLVETLTARAGVTPTVGFESADLATIEGLVAAGLGVAVLPEHLAGVSGTVGIPIRDAGAVREIGMVWRTDRELSAPARRMFDFTRGYARRSVT